MTSPAASGVRVYPPVFFAGGIAAGYILEWLRPLPLDGAALRLEMRVAGLAALALWLAFDGWALALLLRAGTSPNPMRATTTLVTAGPYRISRNPIYVGYVFLQIGIALLKGSAWLLAMLVPVLILVDRLVVAREESYLEARFGDAYRAYRDRVRRWL
jgi:protein-S-isoprenylcysteine O-methyltransferase Ste14